MHLGTFLGIVGLMFLLELPDKTMIATIVMGSRARAWAVALGASSAFLVQMGIAVAAGGLLTLLPHTLKETLIGALFLGGAAYLFLSKEEEEEVKGAREGAREHRTGVWREFTTAFVVIFLGEFGDLTQIQAANFEARLHNPLEVFTAGSLALICVSWLGAYGGQLLERVLPLAILRRGGGVVFAALGLVTYGQLLWR